MATRISKKQKLIQKLEQDIEFFKEMGREKRANGVMDSWHFYRGKINQCQMIISYLKENP
jgi:hypothetical protein